MFLHTIIKERQTRVPQTYYYHVAEYHTILGWMIFSQDFFLSSVTCIVHFGIGVDWGIASTLCPA